MTALSTSPGRPPASPPPSPQAGPPPSPVTSPNWHRVAGLRPRLRTQLQLSRHLYRGAVWFVLRDPASGRSHRFTPGARLILRAMDGQRTVQALWLLADQQLGERAPTQDDMVQLLAQLHAADLMQCDVTPDLAELLERGQKHDRARARQSYANPLSVRVPLLDPDRLLNRLLPWLRPLCNRWGALAWAAVVVPAALLAVVHAGELTHNLSDQVFATGNLLMLWLLFPLIKLLHELGHGLAAKLRGAEVHDAGLMLLVLMPVPYVDVSASSAFPDKRDRALVAAAGMAVELFLAGLAMFVWLLAEPGLLRAVAFNTMLVAGLSTLVFNGNPLLRYDAYFILADLVEIPNLGQRANRYLGALLQRWLFRADDVALPPATPGERAWFIGYAITSFCYRTWVSLVIVLFIASEFVLIGAALAVWAVCTMLLLPLGKLLHHLASGPALQRVRGRVRWVAGGGMATLLALLLLLPLPFRSQTQGVVWLPEQALVRAGADGVLQRHLAAPGSRVQRGDALTLSVDPALQTSIRVGQARIAELQAQLGARWVVQPVEADLLRQDLAREQAALDQLQQRARDLVVRSPSDGIFQVGQAQDQLGRFHRQGALLGHVSQAADEVAGAGAGAGAGAATTTRAISAATTVVRVVVPQGDVDLVRSADRSVALRPSWLPGQVWKGTVLREVPAGDVQLPSAALTPRGGGPVVVDPRDQAGLRGMERSFQLDIAVPAQAVAWYGARVHIRFQHPAEPLALQWWRSLRQAFLRQFPSW